MGVGLHTAQSVRYRQKIGGKDRWRGEETDGFGRWSGGQVDGEIDLLYHPCAKTPSSLTENYCE